MEYRCELIKDLLSLYLDGLCSDYTKKIVDEHIIECADCKYLLRTLRQQDGLQINSQAEREKLNPLKKIKRRNQIITISSIVCTVLIMSILYINLFQIGFTASTSAITVDSIEMLDDEMTFSLELSSNTRTTKIINTINASEGNYASFLKGDQAGNVYIKANLVLAWPVHQSNSYKTTFGFDQGGLGNERIKAIYLVGKNENDIKLIWKNK